MRLAYADPPYLGGCVLYGHEHGDDGKCWDEPRTVFSLIQRLKEYDGWVLHASSPSLALILGDFQYLGIHDYRVMPWVKPFAAFKANVPVAYAWEPVIVKAARKPEVTGRMTMRDYISEGITLERGTIGAKPERVCMWAFEVMGADPDDELVDLYPGSGAVGRAWDKWQHQLDLKAEQRIIEESFLW